MRLADATIALAIDGGFLGGGHVHLLSLAVAAKKEARRVVLFSSEPGPFADRARSMGLEVVFVPMGKRPDPRAARAWRRAIAAVRPDLLHLHGAVAGLWGRFSAPAGLRVVHTIHGIHFPHRKNPIVRWSFWAAERALRDRSGRTLCVSASDATEAARLGIARADRTQVVSNGIDVAAAASAIALSRSAWNVPPAATLLGVCGRLDPVKGQRVAIAALKALLPRRSDLHLVLVGTGEDRGALERAASGAGVTDRVHFAGFVDDVAAALKSFDVHLMPSLWEAQGIVLMEAMAAGVPSIASNVGGIPEVARADREALLVPPGDGASLAQAIDRLLSDGALRSGLVAASRDRVRAFDLSVTLPVILGVYREMLG